MEAYCPVITQMSQTPGPSHGGGKATREKRRLSADQPYKKTPRTAMPATRHSPNGHGATPSFVPSSPLPIGDILKELALLRQSMEGKFVEAGQKTDALRDEVVGKLEANDQAVSELQLAVTDVTLGVDENRRAINEVRAEVERREVQLPDKVRAIVHEALDRPGTRPTPSGIRHRPLGGQRDMDQDLEPATDSTTGNKGDAYWLARRSLRLWPVSREGDLTERTVEFLVNELRLDQQHATSLSLTVKRAGTRNQPTRDRGKTGEVRDEVLVVFESSRERDDVRSFARNLERKGRGMRLEIPDHLWPSFRVLQGLGYELKQKNPSLRRNVLFDDNNLDLKMDFSTDGENWKTVIPSEAKKTLAKLRPQRTRKLSATQEELETLLRSGGGDSMEEDDEY